MPENMPHGPANGQGDLPLPVRARAWQAFRRGLGSTATTLREGGRAHGDPVPPRDRDRLPLLPPRTLVAGRFRLAAPLGRGGMGEVYRAYDLLLGQTVALKFVLPERASRPAEGASLRQEVRLARGIAHPNVCKVFDVGEADGRSFLSMEHIDGEDLAARLARRGPLPLGEALAIGRQMASGLAAIHDGGLIHCDIKPANVMIDGRDRVRIIDFGVAIRAGETSHGRLAGTLEYMAPEQRARGEVSVRTDLYSLAFVFHQMATGRPAEPAGTAPELPEGYGARTRAVLARCLAPDPERRPASALEVEAAFAATRSPFRFARPSYQNRFRRVLWGQ